MSLTEIAILFIIAFLPPVFYVVWIRNSEKYNREKWLSIFICFIWGATIAIIASIILELLLGIPLVLTSDNPSVIVFLTVVIIAPFVEEFTKPLALNLKTVKKEIDELEDGLIYGAVAGLGFSATENLFYGWDTYVSEGLLSFLILISLRSFAGCLLHASATAWSGYGFGKFLMKHSKFIKVIPYFLFAVLIHGFYNFLPVYGAITGNAIAFIFALMFVLLSIVVVRKKIKDLDIASGQNIS